MLKEVRDYLKDNPQGHWFKAKLYGWGWTPVTWQGWAAIFIYLGGLALISLGIDESSADREMLLRVGVPALLLTVALVYVLLKKGEKPRWQWGPPKKK